MGKVYITGAGPGDIELLTLKAYKLLQKADVIVYDKLINKEILDLASKHCKLVFVGKQRANHIMPQEQINEILYTLSLEHSCVVRLKGGDPFVFGRGAEEALYLREKNISYEIIPGISSSVAVPAYAGIPVTHRGVSISYRVITGHETPNKHISQMQWESFLNDETIVFLMGYYNLELLTSKLISLGKDEDTACAVISKGCTKEQKVVSGILKDIVQKASNLETPALIVIGEVVKLRENIAWFEEEFEI